MSSCRTLGKPHHFPMQKLKMSLKANVYCGVRLPVFFWRHTGDIYSSFIPCLDSWQFDLLMRSVSQSSRKWLTTSSRFHAAARERLFLRCRREGAQSHDWRSPRSLQSGGICRSEAEDAAVLGRLCRRAGQRTENTDGKFWTQCGVRLAR
jgi:hypothetical protein